MKKTKTILTVLVCIFFCAEFVKSQAGEGSISAPCIPCDELMHINLPDVLISQAVQMEERLSHCKIIGTIGKEIHFELLLPKTWNSRYVMGGNGGFAGSLQYNRDYLAKGYATGGTDTGHEGSDIRADWALNNMERQLDF